MNGLSKDVDLTPFKSRQLAQVCFGAWNVAFLFDGPVRIVVESSIVITNTGGDLHRIDDFRNCAAELCSFVGLTVVDAIRSDTGGIELHLSSGTKIEIESLRGKYESFQVHLGDQMVVA